MATTNYNLVGSFNNTFYGSTTFSFNLTVGNLTNIVTAINSQTFNSTNRGSLTLTLNAINSTSNPATSSNNDNVMRHTSITNTFNNGGLSFADTSNSGNIFFYTVAGINRVVDDIIGDSTLLTITQACLLDISK